MASMDVKQASASGNSKRKRTLRQRKLLLNEKVEVRSMEEGFLGSWHTGIVIECDKPGRRCIKYDNLLDDDECGNLVDSVCVSPVVDGVDSDSLNKHNYRGNVRPIPPKFEFNKWNIHYGQCVDVNYTDAWWEGVIFDHEDGSEERKIFFPDLGDEMLIPVNSMRITHDWDEVSGVWKQRGNWIFLELIEKYEEKLYLAVSVKQLWYDVREEKGFKKIKEWTSTFMDLWELLVFEVIEDNFKITVDELLNVIVSDGLLPETQTALESDLFVIDDNINFETQISPPESTQPIPDADMDPEEELGPSYAVVSTDQNLLNKDTVIDHEVVIKDVMDFNATGTDEPFQAGPDSSVVASGIDHQAVCSTEQGASNINSSNKSNMVVQIEAICALPFNLDTSGFISDDVGIFGNVAKKMSRRIEHSMTKNTGKWMPVCQPPEPESNRNAIDQYLAHHETAKSEKLESRSALLSTLKKHISYLGWKFEYMRGKCKLVQRYVSPNGKVCYSLNEVCKHLKKSSSKMECDADPTSANASISDLQLCQIPERPLQTQDPNYSSPAVVPSEENTVSIEPEYCPQAVKEYYMSIIQNQTNKDKKDLKILKMKARAHLVAEQWKYHCMDKGEKKYCYVSPTGVVYKSLESACGKHLLDNGSHMHKMKTRNSRNAGLKNVLEMDGKLRHSRDQHITLPRMRKRVKKAVSPSTSYQNPQTILSWLIDNNVVVPREKVSYCSRKGCNSRKDGKITCNGIKCNCCQKLFTINDFEVHAGGTNCRRTANMFLKDGRSLLDCQMEILGSLRNGSLPAERCHSINDTQCKDKNDYICSVCHYGGELMLCDQCPSSFHKRCLGLKDIPDGNWFCPSCCCGICGQSKFQQDTSQTVGGLLIACGQCERKYHRGCLKTSGPVTQVEHYSTESWFCSTTCEKIFSGLQELIGKPIPIGENNLTWTLCKYLNPNVCHTDTPKVVDLTENASKLSVALDVMHECFEPMMEPHSSRDLVEDVIFCSGSDLNRLNCEGFYTVLLESNDELITVATLRVHGQKVAEVPLVGTHVQRRRRGMCRILMNMLEKKLMELGVERLVLPAVPSLLKTWTSSFGFSKMTVSERLQFLDYTFLNFQDAIMCQKLLVKIPPDESSLMKEIQPILHHNSDFDKSSPDSEVYQAEQIEGSRNVGRGLLEISAGNNRDVLSDQTDTLVEVKQKHHLEHSSQTSNECSMDDHSVKRTDDVIDEHVPLRYYKRKRKSSVEPEAIQCSGV